MKGIIISKQFLITLTLLSAFALTACSNQPADDGTGTGGTTTDTGSTSGGSTTGGGTTTASPYKGFVVQLIATASEAKAESIKNEFAGEGYNAFVNPITVNGQLLYRVQIGPYGTDADAQRVMAQMKGRYQKNPSVIQAIIKENP